ncbi:TldD/PmbA family protein [Bacillus sp. RG28]|uniref:TldD/PmbA family protein n=1 Tax=Gottfriedia endophytica TaxID=2820819 RepID=A0A940SL01_9BACI|nr:TldD/PmbA family protein [Gottfriedia endophytica]MBP0726559.1 TldD/PmbA family protein [Gottfriedia endophytica]
MKIQEFKDLVFKRAAELNLIEYELYYHQSDSVEINVFQQEIDQYSNNSEIGVSFRCLYEGKMGYSFTEKLNEEEAMAIVDHAKDSALFTENDDKQFIHDGNDEIETINLVNNKIEDVSIEDKFKFTLNLEKNVLEESEKVSQVMECTYSEKLSRYGIINSKGLNREYQCNNIMTYAFPVIKEEDKAYSDYSFKCTSSFYKLDAKELAKNVVKKVESKIGGKSITSGAYKVVIENETMAHLLQTFSGVFSSENTQKGLSLLKGKEGSKIASSNVTIIDNPHLEDGAHSFPFDSEGVATTSKKVVDQGNLVTLLYNLSTANKENRKSTGNGFKSSYQSPVTVLPSNFYIENGERTFEQLIQNVENGLLITSVEGTHAGANMVSGDFSLAASGFKISEGEISTPVEQITISGNFFDLLNNIEAVGSDLSFFYPYSGYFGSPSVIVSEISVAGE